MILWPRRQTGLNGSHSQAEAAAAQFMQRHGECRARVHNRGRQSQWQSNNDGQHLPPERIRDCVFVCALLPRSQALALIGAGDGHDEHHDDEMARWAATATTTMMMMRKGKEADLGPCGGAVVGRTAPVCECDCDCCECDCDCARVMRLILGSYLCQHQQQPVALIVLLGLARFPYSWVPRWAQQQLNLCACCCPSIHRILSSATSSLPLSRSLAGSLC